MPFKLDPALREYATDRQWEKLQALEKYGSGAKAAEALGVVKSNINTARAAVMKRAAQHGYAPDNDMLFPTAPGYVVRGTSTLYDMQSGEARLQWVKTKLEDEQLYTAMQEAVAAFCENIKPLKKSKPPKVTNDNLMSVYPVGDHHIGMLAWGEEAEADYNTSEAERLLTSAMDYLVEAAPASVEGLVILLGDFLHYDSYESVTPQSKHQLDADSRFPRLVRAAMRAVRYSISKALQKHETVRVIVVAGNHDPSSMVFLREALFALYENEPRVEIDRSPKLFHYHKFGKCLIGTHHGDKVKMAQLPLVMAADVPEEWGATRHRTILTGHVHNDKVQDFNGCKVESVRILAPADAWAYGAGYRTPRDMKRIDYHAEYGEVSRQIVTPEMCA
jgi:predicted phosphodiesterase